MGPCDDYDELQCERRATGGRIDCVSLAVRARAPGSLSTEIALQSEAMSSKKNTAKDRSREGGWGWKIVWHQAQLPSVRMLLRSVFRQLLLVAFALILARLFASWFGRLVTLPADIV